MWVPFRGMRELFQSGEGFLVGEIQDLAMRLDHIEVESGDAIEKSLIGT